MSSGPEIYQLKIRLLGISPMIWRRVLVPASVTLRELHGILQVAMGWEGIHLFLFDVHALRYGSFELHAGNPEIQLDQFGLREMSGSRMSMIWAIIGSMKSALRRSTRHQRRLIRYARAVRGLVRRRIVGGHTGIKSAGMKLTGMMPGAICA